MSVLQRNPHQPMLLAQYPLVKYSYAETSSDQHGPINWTHVQSNDLNAIFEKEPVQQRLKLRVVRAREQLEDIDLNDFAREATQQAIARQTRITKPTVTLLVKDPCLAFRFPSGRDQMHRFQLKFASSRDYREGLDIFREINCPFSETSSDHNMRSASSRPESSSSRITNSTSPAFNGGIEWGNIPGNPGVQPWNSGFLRSHTTLGTPTDRMVSHGTAPPNKSFRLTSPTSFIPESHYRNAIKSPALDESLKDSLGSHTFSQFADSRTQEQERPITAPTLDTQALEQVLPPKRDLPFSKPGPRLSSISSRHAPDPRNHPDGLSTVSVMTNASSRPATALPRVTVPPTSSPARQLRLELEDSRRGNTNRDHDHPTRGQILSSSPLLETSAFGTSSTEIGNTASHYKATTQSPNPSNLSPVVQNKSPISLRMQPQEQQQYQQSINNHNNADTTTTTTPVSTHPFVVTSADLTAYLTTPESERSQLVNNWICQQLEDDGFRTLCQDVERVWQRIAFGNRMA
ncbi:conserved hypothetical protein [Talaromyces stipitatus ATCC 10500]|uniref:Uncharacterized protein n=1 Tax=Talaromyces stipitatus (strain ATCC 10500 / CBS 375.48 / QM 6759 / NRRL 1006) TaxID=441959 RepID=B8LY68_TALSN|nr:uncharacterized protein TSTA_067490 [Talaromyces stipitatus ATCC 10500]EED23313.1 conserved hypothetical protein [Talaromyces stipitatus ATCC 10500]